LSIDGKAYFAASDIKYLESLLTDRIDRLEQSRESLIAALPDIQSGFDTVIPKIRFYEGEDGMKQTLKDMMWHEGATVEAVWNDVEMRAVFDTAFLEWWNTRRIARQIRIHWIVPNGSEKYTPIFYDANLDTIISTNMQTIPKMTRLVYAHKVVCISSNNEAFGCIVESQEFAQLESRLVSDVDRYTVQSKKQT